MIPPLEITSGVLTGAAALFAEGSGFGPALVATSLGISKEELAAAQDAGGGNLEKVPSGTFTCAFWCPCFLRKLI
jgi:hypothetical protein